MNSKFPSKKTIDDLKQLAIDQLILISPQTKDASAAKKKIKETSHKSQNLEKFVEKINNFAGSKVKEYLSNIETETCAFEKDNSK